MCTALKTKLEASCQPCNREQPIQNNPFKSSGRRERCPALLRTHVFTGSTMVLSGCCMLFAARTPCSSDTNHSFVLGIVLGFYEGCDYTDHSHLGGYSQAQHMNAEGYGRILLPCTQTKDALLQTCQRQDQVTEHHPVTTNSTPNHGRSQLSVLSTHAGSTPWCFPASPFFTSSTMMNFIQDIPKEKQTNKQKEIM